MPEYGSFTPENMTENSGDEQEYMVAWDDEKSGITLFGVKQVI